MEAQGRRPRDGRPQRGGSTVGGLGGPGSARLILHFPDGETPLPRGGCVPLSFSPVVTPCVGGLRRRCGGQNEQLGICLRARKSWETGSGRVWTLRGVFSTAALQVISCSVPVMYGRKMQESCAGLNLTWDFGDVPAL